MHPYTLIGRQASTLTGWPALQDLLMKLDKTMVDEFNDDISTLLTFVSDSGHWPSDFALIRGV